MEHIIFEVSAELSRILLYWRTHSPDTKNGGFIGRIDGNNTPHPYADKGAVLTARILWTFSAAYTVTRSQTDLEVAHRAFDFLSASFTDREHGGVYWTLDDLGVPKETHKQIYAQAFAVYGLSEYYRATGNGRSLELANSIVACIEATAADPAPGGYREAFARDWSARDDQRLSSKEINAAKTANTHLHLLEAYANLYDVSPDALLKQRLRNLLRLFRDKFIDGDTFHLKLFFTEDWQPLPGPISYGHDIEASWLLFDSANKCGDPELMRDFEKLSLPMLHAAMEGLAPDGGMYYELKTESPMLIKEKHWWVQAEAMTGFINAWKITGNIRYLELFKECWAFTKQHIMDFTSGDWIWGVDEAGRPMNNEDKLGIWKCPYHNARCCIEIVKMLSVIAP